MSLVGWVERQRNPSPGPTRAPPSMGFAQALNPSYEAFSLVSSLRNIFASGFSFLFSPSSLPTPERGDWRSAGRRPALIRVAQVTRDATLARHGPSRATGRPASRRSAVALSAQVPPPSPLPGPARRLHAPLARLPGCGCRAFRIRGYQPRSTPHPAPPSGSLLESAPHERDVGVVA
jgi:hypothetical protein